MVDDPAQLDLVDRARERDGLEVRVCLELDTSLQLLGGRVRVGARRSPLRSPAQLAELARSVARRPGFRLVGLMAYEGHVAGVGDAVAGQSAALARDPADAGRGPQGTGRAARRGGARGAGGRAGSGVRQRRRHRQCAAHGGRGRGDRDRGGLGALRAAALRQLHIVQRASGRAVRPAGGAPAGRRRRHGARRRIPGVGRGRAGPAAGAVSAGGAALRPAGGRGRGADAAARLRPRTIC